MQSLFITATGTDVGKTHTCLHIIKALASKGYKVGVYKPIETGVDPIAADATTLLKACQEVNDNFKDLTVKDITAYCFPLPAAPFCADIDKIIEPKKIMEKYEELCKHCDILVVEGAGGLMVPITREYMMINLIKDMSAKALLVTPSKLGCINDTLQSILTLKTFDIDFDWCVNIHEDAESFKEVSKPYYDEIFPNWWSVDKNINDYINKLAITQ